MSLFQMFNDARAAALKLELERQERSAAALRAEMVNLRRSLLEFARTIEQQRDTIKRINDDLVAEQRRARILRAEMVALGAGHDRQRIEEQERTIEALTVALREAQQHERASARALADELKRSEL